MALECLRRCKTKIVIRIDFCGGIETLNAPISMGDILIPKLAYCDDGTSPHYIRTNPSLVNELDSINNPMSQYQNLITGNQINFISRPDKELKEILLEKGGSLFGKKVKEVALWTTDALFCETPEFVRSMQSINVECVDMESSILFLLGKLYNIKTTSVLSVSDIIGNPKYDLLTSKEIHPDMLNGIDNAIKLLINTLPKIKFKLF
jgi:purine-nucleoside phosphorylase